MDLRAVACFSILLYAVAGYFPAFADTPNFCDWAVSLPKMTCTARYACVDDALMQAMKRASCACLRAPQVPVEEPAGSTTQRAKFACCYGIYLARNPQACPG